MAFSFKKFWKGINIVPKSSSDNASQGDVEVLSTDTKAHYHNGTTNSPIVTETHASQGANRLQSKDLDAGSTAVVDPSIVSKKLTFDVSGASSSTSVIIKSSQTANRTVTLPDATDTLTGRATADTLTNKTIDATNNTISHIADANISPSANISRGKIATGAINRIVVNDGSGALTDNAALSTSRAVVSDASGFLTTSSTTTTQIGYLAGAGSNIHGDSDAATLSNKTFGDSPTFTQIATPASPSSGFNKIYPKSDGFFYSLDSSGAERKIGSGAGAINYIAANPDAESGTTGWATYADAAGTSPVDGTGGSPSHITLTSSGTSPLRGTKSFLMSNSGSTSAQGEGVSFDFTIDAADQATVLAVNFDYTIASGTFVAGSQGSSITASDVTLWVYDKTNSTVIQLAPYVLTGNGSGDYHFKSIFQTASNSTSYRLILHVGSTNTSAWGLKFDNVFVGPQAVAYGAPITDWQTYTPTWNGAITNPVLGSGSLLGFWRRVGDSMQIKIYLDTGTTSTYGSGNWYFSIPSGYSIDSTKGSNPNTSDVFGTWTAVNSSTNRFAGQVSEFNSTNIIALATPDTGSPNSVNPTVPFTWAASTAGQSLAIFAQFPVTGWSSSVLMSNDTDTRVVAMKAHATTPTGSLAAAFNGVVYGTTDSDTHGGYNASTGIYTVPVSGYYDVVGGILVGGTVAAGNRLIAKIYVNGASSNNSFIHRSAGTQGPNHAVVSAKSLKLNVGDTLQVFSFCEYTSPAYSGDQDANFFTVNRVSGPAAIAATETVAVAYNTSSQNITNNTPTALTCTSKEYDTHGAYSTSTGVFTCPVSGKYRISAACIWAANSAGQRSLSIYKNGFNFAVGDVRYPLGSSVAVQNTMSRSVQCLAGDTLAVYVNQTSGGALALDGVAADDWICIERIGN